MPVHKYYSEPVSFTVRWREMLDGSRGSTILSAHSAWLARQEFRRMYPHREVTAFVLATRPDNRYEMLNSYKLERFALRAGQ